MLEILMLGVALLALGPALILGTLVCGGLHLFGDVAGALLGGFLVLLAVLLAAGVALGLAATVAQAIIF